MERAEELKSLLKPQATGADCDTEDLGNFQHIICYCAHRQFLILKIQYSLSKVDFCQLAKHF